MKYKVIAKKNLDTLNRHTRKWLENGWQLYSGVVIQHVDEDFSYFTQVLYKEKS